MYPHRWQKEFEEFIKYKNAVILVNNVKDKYLCPRTDSVNRYELLDLIEYLIVWGKDKFKVLKVYDSVDKVVDYGVQKESKPDEVKKQDDEFASTAPSKHSFGRESTVDRDLIAIGEELINQKSVCYIFGFADKTLPIKSYSLDEHKLLLRVEKIIQKMHKNNRLILIYSFDDQIPPEFFRNNPRTKVINVPPPDRSEIRTLFQNYFVIDNKEVERAVNVSHGLKFLEIEQIVNSIGIGNFDLQKYEEAVRGYKFGEKRDYWQEITLDKLKSAGKFFLYETTDSGRGGIQGQDDAVRKVIEVLMNAVANIQSRTGGNPSRPKGVLFFAGPSGVGKTLTAQKLATFLFGSEDKLLRFDMSEYKDEFQVTRLYGAPPGYVGYESGGTLTTAVKENPFSVILFDEIEKAHPRIFDIFLQILSDGRLTDSKGDTVYFAESVIIFTSNIGTRTQPVNEKENLEKLKQQLRLAQIENDQTKTEYVRNQIREHFRQSVENFFVYELSRPELFNRIGKDNIVVFDFITANDARKMLENYLIDLQTKFNKFSANEIPALKLEMNIGELVEHLFKLHSNDIAEFGGRQVVNLIDAEIRNRLAIEVLNAKDSGIANGVIKIFVNKENEIEATLSRS